MDDQLLPWLRAQIAAEKAQADEDLRLAKEAGGTWAVHEGGPLNASYLHVDGAEAAMFHGWNHRENLVLAARFNPVAVAARATAALAQCEAHTAILDAHPLVGDTGDDLHDPRCGVCVQPGGIGCNEWPEDWRTQPWPCPTVRAVALAYQHCPGYREAWKL